MEPRLLRRGNLVDAELEREADKGFNGATPSQTWKHRRSGRAWLLCACFNGATPSQTWKRAKVRCGASGRTASMEPRLLRRGNSGRPI